MIEQKFGLTPASLMSSNGLVDEELEMEELIQLEKKKIKSRIF